MTLNVLAAAPDVTSASPATIAVGSSTTTVTIIGTGFESGAVVQLNGISLPTIFVNGTALQFTLDQSYLTEATTLSFTVVNPQSAPSSPITLIVGVPAPQFTAASVVNAASYTGGAVAPGEIVTIFGSNFGTMANTQVLFGSDAATLVFVNSTQVSATVPYSVAGVHADIVDHQLQRSRVRSSNPRGGSIITGNLHRRFERQRSSISRERGLQYQRTTRIPRRPDRSWRCTVPAADP